MRRELCVFAAAVVCASGFGSSRASAQPFTLIAPTGVGQENYSYQFSPNLTTFVKNGAQGGFEQAYQYNNPDHFYFRVGGASNIVAPVYNAFGPPTFFEQPNPQVAHAVYDPAYPGFGSNPFRFDQVWTLSVTGPAASGARVTRDMIATNLTGQAQELDIFWVTNLYISSGFDDGRNDYFQLASFAQGGSGQFVVHELEIPSFGYTNSGTIAGASAGASEALYAWGAMPIIQGQHATTQVYLVNPGGTMGDLTNTASPLFGTTHVTVQLAFQWKATIAPGASLAFSAGSAVPAPGAGALGCCAALLLTRRRRPLR